MLEHAQRLVVRQSEIPGAGRGVFAAENIPARAAILSDLNYPVKVDAQAAESHKASGVYWLLFKDQDGDEDQCYIALGLSSLINHSDSPNVVALQSAGGKTTNVISLRYIKKGEEILVRYFNAEEYDDLR